MSDWRTASTRVSTTESHRQRTGGRVSSPPKHWPGGKLHAYLPGERITACERETAGLKLWPAKPFLRGRSHERCPDCMAKVRS